VRSARVVAGVVLGACVVVSGGVPAAAAVCDGVSVTCRVGDTGPGGGVVFYDAGTSKKWGRYLEAAPAGWSGAEKRFVWCPSGSKGGSAALDTGDGLGAGRANTRVVVKACGTATAAGAAAAYRGGGLSDWFLPSKGELNVLYKQRAKVGGLAGGAGGFTLYWSSSQARDVVDFMYSAWAQEFADGNQLATVKYGDGRVRPVRAF